MKATKLPAKKLRCGLTFLSCNFDYPVTRPHYESPPPCMHAFVMTMSHKKVNHADIPTSHWGLMLTVAGPVVGALLLSAVILQTIFIHPVQQGQTISLQRSARVCVCVCVP